MLDKNFTLNTWIPALRSGDFEQTNGALHNAHDNGHSYCCLGVAACFIDGVEWLDVGQIPDYPIEIALCDTDTNSTAADVLPASVGERIGLMAGHLIEVPESLVEYKIACGEEDCDLCGEQYFIVVDDEEFKVERDRDIYRIDIAAVNDNGASFETIANILETIVRAEEEASAE